MLSVNVKLYSFHRSIVGEIFGSPMGELFSYICWGSNRVDWCCQQNTPCIFTVFFDEKSCVLFSALHIWSIQFVTLYEITKLVEHKQKKKWIASNQREIIEWKCSKFGMSEYLLIGAIEPNSETSWAFQVIRVYIN